MKQTSYIVLNLRTPNYATVYAAQDNLLSRYVNATLLDGDAPWTIPANTYMEIAYIKPDGTGGIYDSDENNATAYTFSGNTVEFVLAQQALTVPGNVLMALHFFNANDEQLSSFTFMLTVPQSSFPYQRLESADYFNIMQGTLADMAAAGDRALAKYNEYLEDLADAYSTYDTQMQAAVAAAEQAKNYAQTFTGAPRTMATAAGFANADHDLIYVFTGTTDSSYTNGHWYFWNGTAWTDGGVYNSTALTTDPTLSIAGAAADAAACGGLKSAFDLFEKIVDNDYSYTLDSSYYTTTGLIDGDSGRIDASKTGYQTTDFLDVIPFANYSGNSFSTYYTCIALYDASKSYISGSKRNGGYSFDVTDYPSAKYFRASKGSNDTFYLKLSINEKLLNSLKSAISSYGVAPRIDNRYGMGNVLGILKSGGYVDPGNGTINTSQTGYYYSEYIYVGNVNNIYCEKNVFLACYDESKTYIVGYAESYTKLTRITLPSGTKYIRTSVSSGNYQAYLNGDAGVFFRYDGHRIKLSIGKTGTEDFSTIKDGFAKAVELRNVDLTINEGVYDLLTEYASEISSADLNDDVWTQIGFGINAYFVSGAKVTALFNSDSYTEEKLAWAAVHFHPFKATYGNYIMENLDIESSNCRYSVHDEMAGEGTYIHKYINCKMKHIGTAGYQQCIGGGLGLHGYIDIVGGYYDSTTPNVEEPITISYHNGDASGAKSNINVHDVYLAGNGCFSFSSYGQSTEKSIAIISNCSMGATIHEGSGSPNNMEVMQYMCEVRGQA